MCMYVCVWCSWERTSQLRRAHQPSGHVGGKTQSLKVTPACRCWSPAASPRPCPTTARRHAGLFPTPRRGRTSDVLPCQNSTVTVCRLSCLHSQCIPHHRRTLCYYQRLQFDCDFWHFTPHQWLYYYYCYYYYYYYYCWLVLTDSRYCR